MRNIIKQRLPLVLWIVSGLSGVSLLTLVSYLAGLSIPLNQDLIDKMGFEAEQAFLETSPSIGDILAKIGTPHSTSFFTPQLLGCTLATAAFAALSVALLAGSLYDGDPFSSGKSTAAFICGLISTEIFFFFTGGVAGTAQYEHVILSQAYESTILHCVIAIGVFAGVCALSISSGCAIENCL
ncbi:MAG: hypothetical protein JSS50_01620 [Proteobacteria bacterium]|nr:hypothetical protein [Pseudomonadota bacterium]